MICKQCKKEFIISNPKTRNVKFCSLLCRNRFQYNKRGGAAYQRAYLDKRNKNDQPAKNKIECLICHNHYRKVGAHIVQVHGITCREYREQFDLEVKRGLLTEFEREPLREHVSNNGTVNNLKKGAKYRFKKNDPNAGKYKRSHITMERLKKQFKK